MGHEGRHLPNILRKNRKVRGFTQIKLARFFKMKKSNLISLWEKGKAIPDIEQITLLSILHQLPLDEFLADYIEALRIEYAVEIEEFSRQ